MILALLLAFITVAVFWPARNYGFVNYDDPDYVSLNLHVQGGLTRAGLVWAFQTSTGANWHPLTWISLMTDVQLFGYHAGVIHLVNVLFHTTNTILLFVLLRKMTGAGWRSALVAALFALHPLHVESVAWVSERKDVLSSFFGLLTLWMYAGYAKAEIPAPKRKLFYGLALLFFALGLLSKPMVVSLPFVMLLLDYWPLKRFTTGDLRISIQQFVREKIPFFGLSAAFCVVTLIAQTNGRSVQSISDVSIGDRLENVFISYARQLGHVFWPENLAFFYPYPKHWPLEWFVASAILIMILCLGVIWLGRRFPFLLTGWFWFLGMLVPVIGFVQTGIQSMADRHVYLPSIGIFIILVWSAGEMIARRPSLRPVVASLAGIIVVVCAMQTRHQLQFWQSSEMLFRHAAEVTSDNYLATYNVGWILQQKGQLDEAARYYRKAIQEQKNVFAADSFNAYNNLGVIAAKNGNLEEAIQCYAQALRYDPTNIDILDNLGVNFGKAGNLDQAVRQFNAAIRIAPTDVRAYNDLGIALGKQGKIAEALNVYRKAIEVNPDFALAHYNYAEALAQIGQIADATAQLKEALRLNPDYTKAKQLLQTLNSRQQ